MRTLTTAERFGFKLTHLSRHWRARLDHQLRSTGLTQAKWSTLVYLARGGDGMLQKDLARFIGIEGPTLVRLLDSLQALGWIERRPSPQDRRGKRVHLTAAARPTLERFDHEAAAVRADLLAGVSEEELQLCIQVFERILANAGHTDPATGQEPIPSGERCEHAS